MGIIFAIIDVILPIIALVTYVTDMSIAFYVLSILFALTRWFPGLIQGATGCMEIISAIIAIAGAVFTGAIWYNAVLIGICVVGFIYNVYYLYKYFKLTKNI